MHSWVKRAVMIGLVYSAMADCRGDAVFSSAYLGAGDFDAVVGLNTNKTYLSAVNLNGSALTINGVSFSASSGGNPSGTGWSISGAGAVWPSSAWATVFTGELGTTPAGKLASDFIFGGNPAVFMLSGLTTGKTYVLTFYNAAFDVAGGRMQTFLTSSGVIFPFDEDLYAPAAGYGNLLRYTFKAWDTSETVTITPWTNATMHLYGFSMEEVFNKAWSSGANWTSAAWSSAGEPNGAGANASFGAQPAPTTINLDADRTVGHIQFDGTNAWTLSTSSSRTLTLQADTGGVSVCCAPSGVHTVSTAVVLNNDVAKFGAGTLVLSGAATGNKTISIYDGTLQLAGGADRLPTGAKVVFPDTGSPVLDINNQNQTIASLAGGYTNGVVKLGNGTLTVGDAGSTTYGGTISGTGGTFVKTGSGVLRLDGVHTYSGCTIIGGGTLKMGNVDEGAEARYAFESNTVDASGNGHDGSAVDNPSYSSGRFGQAITLNGSSQYVTVPYNMAFELTNFTISVWVNVNVQPVVNLSGPPLVSTRNGGESTFDLQYVQPSSGSYKLHADIGTGSGWLTTGADYNLPGAFTGWNMVTYTVNNSGCRIYVNGEFMKLQHFSGTPLFMKSGEEISFGAQKGGGGSYGSGGYLNGSLDDIAIFDHVLTDGEIRDLYLMRNGQLPINSMVKIVAGGRLDCNGTTQTVDRLVFDGISQLKGTYGVTGSGARFTNDTYFTGMGLLDVLHTTAGTVIEIR